MTNLERILRDAVEAKDNSQLNEWEKSFVEQFEGMNKKQLRRLSSKQYKKLRDISEKLTLYV